MQKDDINISFLTKFFLSIVLSVFFLSVSLFGGIFDNLSPAFAGQPGYSKVFAQSVEAEIALKGSRKKKLRRLVRRYRVLSQRPKIKKRKLERLKERINSMLEEEALTVAVVSASASPSPSPIEIWYPYPDNDPKNVTVSPTPDVYETPACGGCESEESWLHVEETGLAGYQSQVADAEQAIEDKPETLRKLQAAADYWCGRNSYYCASVQERIRQIEGGLLEKELEAYQAKVVQWEARVKAAQDALDACIKEVNACEAGD